MRISGPHRANPDNLHTGEDQPFSSFRRIDILPTPPLQQWQGKDGQVSFLRPPSASPPNPTSVRFISPSSWHWGYLSLRSLRGDPELCHPPPGPGGQQREAQPQGPADTFRSNPGFLLSPGLWFYGFSSSVPTQQ